MVREGGGEEREREEGIGRRGEGRGERVREGGGEREGEGGKEREEGSG